MFKSINLYLFKPFKFIEIQPQKSTDNKDEHPRPRSGHRVVCHGMCLYAVGGYNPKIEREDYEDEDWQSSCPLFKELWQFNTLSRKWTKLCRSPDMPLELASHSAVGRGSFMLVFGGTAMPFGYAASNSVHICHLPTGRWENYDVGGVKPEPMYGQGVILLENKLYVVGGTSGHEFSLDVHCLDIKQREWNYCKPNPGSKSFPEPRYRHEVIEHNNKLYVFGGGQYDDAFSIVKLPTFDLESHYWSITDTSPDFKTRKFPAKRKCHIIQKLDNYVYVHGGIDGTHAYDDLWRLHLQTWEWEELSAKTSTKLYFHSSAATEDGCLYVFGGVYDGEKNLRTGNMLKIWLKIPSLQSLCWEALCYYNPRISDTSTDELLRVGIPKNIVDGLNYPAPTYS